MELKRNQRSQNQSALGREEFCSPVVQPVFSSANAPGICSSTGTHTIALARNSQKACPGSEEIPQPQPPNSLFKMLLQGCFRKEQASILPGQVAFPRVDAAFPSLYTQGLGSHCSFPPFTHRHPVAVLRVRKSLPWVEHHRPLLLRGFCALGVGWEGGRWCSAGHPSICPPGHWDTAQPSAAVA